MTRCLLYNQGLIRGGSGHFSFHHIMYIGPACCQLGTRISFCGNKVAGGVTWTMYCNIALKVKMSVHVLQHV